MTRKKQTRLTTGLTLAKAGLITREKNPLPQWGLDKQHEPTGGSTQDSEVWTSLVDPQSSFLMAARNGTPGDAERLE